MKSLRGYLSGPGLGPMMVKAVTGSAGLRILGMCFAFLVGVLLARALGAEGYGVYGLAMSIIAFLTVPAEFGLPQLLTREVARASVDKDWGMMRGVVRWSTWTVLILSAIVGVLVAVGLFAVGYGLNTSLSSTLMVGLLLPPFVALARLKEATLRGLGHLVQSQVPDALVRPAAHSSLLAMVVLAAHEVQPPMAMGLGVFSALLAYLLAAQLLHRKLPTDMQTALPQTDSREWRSSALPMALTEGMRMMQGHLVILILGWMSAIAFVGVFRVASSVALFVAMPITLLNVVSAPVIARLIAQDDRARLQRLLTWISFAMSAGVLLFSVPFLIDGQQILAMVFGQEFGSANIVLLILCLSALTQAVFGASATLLNMAGYQRRVTRASAISILVLIFGAPAMIGLIDDIGAAIATVLAMSVWNILMWRDAKRLLKLDASIFRLKIQKQPL